MGDTYVISGLRKKRAELSGELIAAEKHILQLRTDLDCLDGAIRLFDPEAEPRKIRPVQTRRVSGPIPRGQCSRAILDMLRRADQPMTAQEIAARLAADYGIDAANKGAMNALVAKVRNALLHQKGLASELRGGAKVWRARD
ncbi:MAG: hypothetical protein ACREE2_12225 [Stellaceae bacterium]